jgi:lipoprotein-anchoring transpeptidase ErfK/SrfK
VRTKLPVILVSLFLLVLGGLAAGAVAYDRSRADTLARGMTIGGLDVGGLTARQAQLRLERDLLAPLKEPLRVDHGKKRWVLGPEEARIAADLDGAVADALARSRGGSMPVRVWRGLTGGRLEEDVDPRVTYSKAAVVRLLDRIRRETERDPVDAKVEWSASGPKKIAGRTGLEVRASELHRRLRAAIVSPTAERRMSARTRRVQPKVTMQQLEDKYATALVVDRPNFRIKLYKRLKEVKSYPIALGKAGNDTPTGLYSIQNKAVNPAWHVPNSDWAGELAGQVIPPGPDNPIKARWMGIYDGVGVHGTSDRGSIGSNASHGCIRMLEEDVIALYDEVPVGAPIYIS